MGKMLLLALNEQEENAIDKIIATLSDYIELEAVQITSTSVLSFPGLEIRQNQRMVVQNGEEINLTRLENTLLYSLLPIRGLCLHRHRYLKSFGIWIAIAVIQVLST